MQLLRGQNSSIYTRKSILILLILKWRLITVINADMNGLEKKKQNNAPGVNATTGANLRSQNNFIIIFFRRRSKHGHSTR